MAVWAAPERAFCALGAGVHGSLICLLVIREAGVGEHAAGRGVSAGLVVPGWGGRVWLVGEVSGELADRGGAGRDPVVRLPPRRFSFVGRTAELGEIAARLGRHTVVTLTGVGGVGKTALAVEAAWIEVSAGRAEMACFIDLVPCRSDEQVVAALVEGVGIRGAAATAGVDAVAEAVSGVRSLLVLDNCEHVLGSARRGCDHLAGRGAGLPGLGTRRVPLC